MKVTSRSGISKAIHENDVHFLLVTSRSGISKAIHENDVHFLLFGNVM